jgi:hypothetical protein
MGRQPRGRQDDRRPPGVCEQDQRAGESANRLDHVGGDEVHRDRQRRAGHAEVEVARDDQVARQRRIFQVSHAGRAHARIGETIVQPRRGPIAEVGADCLMERRHDLKQDEHHAHQAQRHGETVASLDRADEHAHGDAEHGRQASTQQKQHPPGDRHRACRFGQHPEEGPFLPLAETRQHRRILPDSVLHRL